MTRERTRDPREERERERRLRPDDDAAPDPQAGLAALRERTESLLSAGERAIEMALSGNSERFLSATLQGGGQ